MKKHLYAAHSGFSSYNIDSDRWWYANEVKSGIQRAARWLFLPWRQTMEVYACIATDCPEILRPTEEEVLEGIVEKTYAPHDWQPAKRRVKEIGQLENARWFVTNKRELCRWRDGESASYILDIDEL